METVPNKEVLSFMQKDYELKVEYLTAQLSRSWTRFNYFVTFQVALSIGVFGFREAPCTALINPWELALVGLLSSFIWYFFGAQDRFVIEAYRDHIAETGKAIADLLKLKNILTKPYRHVGEITGNKVTMTLYQWRLDKVSTTKLLALFPIVISVFWLVILWRIW